MGSIKDTQHSAIADFDEKEIKNQKIENATPKLSNKLAECHGEELQGIDRSLWDMFAKAATIYANEDAVVSLWQRIALPIGEKQNLCENEPEQVLSNNQEEFTRWKYSELRQAAESLAVWLQNQGCIQGMKLVVCLWNSAEWALFFWAAAKLKMAFVPIDPQLMEESANNFMERLDPYVLLVQDRAGATALGKSSKNVRIRICCGEDEVEGWLPLSEVLSSMPILKNLPGITEVSASNGRETALIVFTSGTTTTPKGCAHTARSLWSQSKTFDPSKTHQHTDRWLVHTPIWHIFAVNNALRAWRYGSCIVLPSKTFDVTASLHALKREKCTRMSAVPTLIRALIEHPEFNGKEELNITHISIGGTMITEEDVKMCESLVKNGKAVTGYGMTEGAPVVMWSRSDPLLQNGFYPGVGKVLPGCRIRITSPSSQRVLNRNELGELHIGGTSVIESYLDGISPESFYKDGVGIWLMTGDQGFIDENDVLQVTGRLKDIIIRGGENIAPVKIESHLMRTVPGLMVYVIGIPDEIAGEVPVAVVHSAQTYSKSYMHDLVKELGPSYALSNIFTLDELFLDGFPLTSTGKVRKDILTKHVVAFLARKVTALRQGPFQQTNGTLSTPTARTLAQSLLDIWTDLTDETLGLNDHVAGISDSITLLRYCDRVWKSLGKKIYLQDFQQHPSITLQAKLLEDRDNNNKWRRLFITFREGPPALEDVILANESIDRYHEIVTAADKTLQEVGLNWQADAEDIIPIRDFWHRIANGPRPQTYRHRILLRLTDRKPSIVRAALEKGLASRPMFRTFLGKLLDDTPFHIVSRPSEKLNIHLITEVQVPNIATMTELYEEDSDANFPRAQMVQTVIVNVKETNATYLIMTYNHSVFDAMSMIQWYKDLDKLFLNIDAELAIPTPFRVFAESVYFSESSFRAKSSVDFHIHRLRGISKYTDAFWPLQKAPGFMSGKDTGSPHYAERLAYRQKNGIIPLKPPRIIRSFNTPGLESLRALHQIQPPVLVKAAVALFNARQTGQEYVIFNNLDDGREWPFLPPWMKDTLPPPLTVDGPMLEWCLNMFRVIPDETVGDFLQRVTADQKELSAHAHAPWFKILEGLGEEAAFAQDASRRQSYNWDVSLRSMLTEQHRFETLQPLLRTDWPDSGIYWVAGLLRREYLCLVANFDDTQLSFKEVNNHIGTIMEIIKKMAEPKNWNMKVTRLLENGDLAL